MARMAVKMGMMSYVKKMAGGLRDFQRDRASRAAGPEEADPQVGGCSRAVCLG